MIDQERTCRVCSNVARFPMHETRKKKSKQVTSTTTPSAVTMSSSSSVKGFSFLDKVNSYSPKQVDNNNNSFSNRQLTSAVSSPSVEFSSSSSSSSIPPVSEKRVSLLDLEREIKKRRRLSGGPRTGTLAPSSSSSSKSTSSPCNASLQNMTSASNTKGSLSSVMSLFGSGAAGGTSSKNNN